MTNHVALEIVALWTVNLLLNVLGAYAFFSRARLLAAMVCAFLESVLLNKIKLHEFTAVFVHAFIPGRSNRWCVHIHSFFSPDMPRWRVSRRTLKHRSIRISSVAPFAPKFVHDHHDNELFLPFTQVQI